MGLRLQTVCVLLWSALALPAAEYFISPTGSASNSGSIGSPWSMAYGLSATNTVPQPGDTIWLRGGVYLAPASGLGGTLSRGSDTAPIIVRNYNGERAIVDGGFGLTATNLWVWGLEITGTGASSSTGYGFGSGRNLKFINCLIYDNVSSGGISQGVEDSEYYGTVIVRSGRYVNSACFGNSIYAQNRTATTNRIVDCIVANGFLEGINIYSAGTTPIHRFHVEGCIAFGNGHCAGGRNFLLGSDIPAENITVLSNVFWNRAGQNNFMLCYGTAQAVAPVVRGNVLHGHVILSGNTGAMEFVGNELFGGEFRVAWPADRSPTAYLFDYNKYHGMNFDLLLHANDGAYPAPGLANLGSGDAAFDRFRTLYQTYTSVANFRPDEHGQNSSGLPTTGTRVRVRPNAYEPGRAHVAILNWERAPTVEVDLSAAGLSAGQEFELRAVQDYFGARFTARYDGLPVRVPMTNWPVAQPKNSRVTLTTTFPDFGAFVLLPLGLAPTNPPPAPTALQAAAGDAEVTLTWTPSVGATGYQVKRSQTSGSAYATLATVAAPRYLDTSVANGTTYFYVVSAVNSAGQSPNSPEASAQPRATAPPVPSDLIAAPGNGQASLRWTGSPKATAYRVKRSTTGAAGSFATVATVAAAEFTDVGLVNGRAYYYAVSALNAVGESADSAPVNVTPSQFPTPLVSLDFNEPGGATVSNHGSAGGALTATTPVPARSANTPDPVGGDGSMDFGTSAGDFGVDSAGEIAALRELPSFTITGWVNNRSTTQGSGGNRIVTWINGGGDGVDLVYRSDGSLQLGVNQWPDGSPARSSANRIPTDPFAGPNNWRFFAVSYDATLPSGQAQFYFGTTQSEATLDVARNYARSAVGSDIGPLTIGHFNVVVRSGARDRIFRGLIDEVNVFAQALSLEEIRAVQLGAAGMNRPPRFSAIPDQTTTPDTPLAAIPFTLRDDRTPSYEISLAASSSNRKLVPDEGLVLGGSDANRTLSVFPAPGQVGKTIVTLTASDGEASASVSFVVSVSKVNRPPVVEAGFGQTMHFGSRAILIGSVNDDGLPDPPGALVMRWSKLDGPGTVRFGNSNALSTTATFSAQGLYTLRLEAGDGEATTADTVSVLVTPPQSPFPPVLGFIALESLTQRSALVGWTTDTPATTQAEFGLTAAYGRASKLDQGLVTNHVALLNGLEPGTTYHFRVKSKDAAGRLTQSADHTFTTAPGPGQRRLYFPLTARSATLTAPMALFPHAQASGQVYLTSPVAGQGRATFTFQAPAAGTYVLWARVLASAGGVSSLAVAVDSAAEDVFDIASASGAPVWRWQRVNGRGAGGSGALDPRYFPLAAGAHSLVVRAREANFGLDRLLVTNDPEFTPQDDQPVAGIATARTLTNLVVRFEAAPGLHFIANQLSRDNNTVSAVLPGFPDGVELYKVNPITWGATVNRMVQGRWSDPNMPFAPGEGAVLNNVTPQPVAVTFTGTLPPPTSPRPLAAGLHLIGCVQPFSGPISECLDVPLADGDVLYTYDSDTGEFTIHSYNAGQWDVPPTVDVAESFYLEILPQP